MSRIPYAVYKRSGEYWTEEDATVLWEWFGDIVEGRASIVSRSNGYFYDDGDSDETKVFSNCWQAQNIDHIKKENILVYEDMFESKPKFNYCLKSCFD